MNVLGINHYFHDTSMCLVAGGKLVAAIEEERFNRDKHTAAFPERAAEKLFAFAGLAPEDVTHVAVSVQPTHKWPAKLAHAARYPRHARGFLEAESLRLYSRHRRLHDWIRRTFASGTRPELCFVQHHLAHAGGSFLVSGYDEAALLSIDGSGEWATSLLGHGRGNRVEIYQQSWFPMSLGAFYEAVTEWLGFRPNYDEGKTMGLAPFGDARLFYPKVAEIVRVDPDGRLWLDLSYFNHQFHRRPYYSERFVQAFGGARGPGRQAPFADHHRHVAAAFQRVLEDRALEMCEILHRRTLARRLVLAGGVALNSVMNGRIVREGPFEDLYVMPGAGDSGTSIGAAFYVWNTVLGQPREFVHDDPFVGNAYGDDEIKKTLEACSLPIECHDDIERLAAELLARGRLIGWFQGRMEFGPRSLGSRSILANPMLSDTKERLNARVKHREAFRPFAPACPVERMSEFFDSRVENPFMLKVCAVHPEKRHLLPATTHVDGSARLQTVAAAHHPRFHRLLTEFGKLTGVPVLLNTSFNVMGEPIVESPIDALRCFFSTGLDELILGSHVIRKRTD